MMTFGQVRVIDDSGGEILDTCLSERDALNGTFFCLPNIGEMVLITQRLSRFISTMREHTIQLFKPASQTVLPAFKQAFPCP